MKKRKLRGYVIPTICFMLITTILFSSYKMYQILMISRNNTIKETIKPVVKEEEENVTPTINETKSIIRPYNQNTVVAQIPFYDADATDDEQKAALIYYEGIYMQNTGVLYTDNQSFDVLAVLDGTVKDIKEDEIMGNIIEIEHSKNLTTIYQSVDDVKVTVGASVSQGTVIAKSGANKLNTDSTNALHFEVYYKGQLINPEEFYLYNYNDIMEKWNN